MKAPRFIGAFFRVFHVFRGSFLIRKKNNREVHETHEKATPVEKVDMSVKKRRKAVQKNTKVVENFQRKKFPGEEIYTSQISL